MSGVSEVTQFCSKMFRILIVRLLMITIHSEQNYECICCAVHKYPHWIHNMNWFTEFGKHQTLAGVFVLFYFLFTFIYERFPLILWNKNIILQHLAWICLKLIARIFNKSLGLNWAKLFCYRIERIFMLQKPHPHSIIDQQGYWILLVNFLRKPF